MRFISAAMLSRDKQENGFAAALSRLRACWRRADNPAGAKRHLAYFFDESTAGKRSRSQLCHVVPPKSY